MSKITINYGPRLSLLFIAGLLTRRAAGTDNPDLSLEEQSFLAASTGEADSIFNIQPNSEKEVLPSGCEARLASDSTQRLIPRIAYSGTSFLLI